MPLAPILSQSPELDIYGNFAKGQQMGILKNQDARAQAGEVRAQAGEEREQTLFSQEQSDREKMQGILETMGSGAKPEKIASELMASGNIKAANEVLNLAKGQRQVQGYDLENALTQQTQRNKKYEEQIRAEVGLTNNALSAIDGIVDTEEKGKVLDDYLDSIEIVNQQRSKAGLAPVVIPDAIKSGDVESRVQLLQGIARNGNMQLDMINRTKPEDMTAEIKNFMYGQSNPEFAEQQRLEGEGRKGETTKLVDALIAEGSAKTKAEALEILKGGAGRRGRLEADIDIGGKAASTVKFGEKVGEDVASQLSEKRLAAEDAKISLYRNKEARKLIEGGVITGKGANFIKEFGKALNQIGWDASEDPIANTEAFVAQRGLAVGAVIKLFGSGTGLSDADREYAEKIAAGNISLNEKSIKRILDMTDKQSNWIIDNFNEELGRVNKDVLPYDISVEKTGAAKKEIGNIQELSDEELQAIIEGK